MKKTDWLVGSPEQSPLGQTAAFPHKYDPQLLYPMPRLPRRAEIGIEKRLPFHGADLWTAFELSWLNQQGKPEVAIARFAVPAASTHMVESKSLKLYLNSFSNSRFINRSAVALRIQADLSRAAWHGGPVEAPVEVTLAGPDAWGSETVGMLQGVLLDSLDIACDRYELAPDLLVTVADAPQVSESLVSHLLKSNCLVTGQPDWGSLQIHYTGRPIDREGLLRYIVSFRHHNEFHEQCVERIFMDITRRCQPTRLDVYARYTRRGGVDINPWRSSHPGSPPASIRTPRQ